MIEDQTSPSYGGYFELELNDGGRFLYQDSSTFQSARVAFRALLQEMRPTRVWVPKHICNAMIAPLEDEGISYSFYSLNESLDIHESIDLKDTEWLLYVNYYGVCQAQLDNVFQKYPASQIVCDFSQSFFDPPPIGALATIYSARKFFGYLMML